MAGKSCGMGMKGGKQSSGTAMGGKMPMKGAGKPYVKGTVKRSSAKVKGSGRGR